MEVWKPLARFGNVIEVSDQGRVRRVDSMVNCKNGHKRLARGRILKSRRHPWGYHWFEFSVAGVRHCDFGHRLVMEAFVGPCPEGYYVLHGDNTPSNNRLAILCFGLFFVFCVVLLLFGLFSVGVLFSWFLLLVL